MADAGTSTRRSARTDGRVLRGERNRDAIVEAVVALIRSGNLRPTAREVSEYAGVSQRSIYQHFDSVESLHEEIAAHQFEQARELLGATPIEGSRDSRVTSFVDYRATLFETLGPLQRAAQIHAYDSPTVQRTLKRGAQASLQQIDGAFAPEFRSLEPNVRRERVYAIDATVCGPVWERLRSVHGLSKARARRVLEVQVRSLLDSQAEATS